MKFIMQSISFSSAPKIVKVNLEAKKLKTTFEDLDLDH